MVTCENVAACISFADPADLLLIFVVGGMAIIAVILMTDKLVIIKDLSHFP